MSMVAYSSMNDKQFYLKKREPSYFFKEILKSFKKGM